MRCSVASTVSRTTWQQPHEPGKKYKLEVKVDVDGDGTSTTKRRSSSSTGPFVLGAEDRGKKEKKSVMANAAKFEPLRCIQTLTFYLYQCQVLIS